MNSPRIPLTNLMPGQFRYCDEEQFNLHLALAEGVVI